MKIIAHSMVPPGKLPYVHLGYLAATETIPSKGFFLTGTVFFILAIFSLAKGARVKRVNEESGPKWIGIAQKTIALFLFVLGIQGILDSVALFGLILILLAILLFFARTKFNPPENLKKRLMAITAGLALLIAGIYFALIYSFNYGKVIHMFPEDMTAINARQLLQTINEHAKKNEAIPKNASLLLKEWGLRSAYIEDGWFRQLRIDKTTRNGQISYIVTSAGPDRTFDTADDLTFDKLP
ncbi:MAG: hypothetical protein HZA48_08435 [Planctomycetes bacterium]|nr:hypothetical protein [Planctomycetota bacterium]